MSSDEDFFEFLDCVVAEAAMELASGALTVAREALRVRSLALLPTRSRRVLLRGLREWIEQQTPRLCRPLPSDGVEVPRCAGCGEPIPWCELFVALRAHECRCSWCVMETD